MILGLIFIFIGCCIYFGPIIHAKVKKISEPLPWIDVIGITCCAVLCWGLGVFAVLLNLIKKGII